MKTKLIKKITLSAMFLAIGYVLPFLTGQIPEIGKMLLPMHIPVMLSGFILGGGFGLFLGFVLPITRSLIFSMPILYPTAISMAFELSTYGFVAGFLFERAKYKCLRSLYRCLLISMLAGRAVLGVAESVLLGFFGDGYGITAFLTSAFARALPGIILQLLIIPAIMLTLHKTHIFTMAKNEVQVCEVKE